MKLSKRPPRGDNARSGGHPAVKAYQTQLRNVDRGATAATNALDQMLQEFLEDVKRTPPSQAPPDSQR
jgi:hypothetical protein